MLLFFWLAGSLVEYSPLLAALAHARQDMEEKQLIRQRFARRRSQVSGARDRPSRVPKFNVHPGTSGPDNNLLIIKAELLQQINRHELQY
jgi:hypothetical protein